MTINLTMRMTQIVVAAFQKGLRLMVTGFRCLLHLHLLEMKLHRQVVVMQQQQQQQQQMHRCRRHQLDRLMAALQSHHLYPPRHSNHQHYYFNSSSSSCCHHHQARVACSWRTCPGFAA